MRNLLPLATLLTLAGPVACGPAPAAVAPSSASEVKPAPAQVATGAPLDLSPVAEPADIVGVLRWSNPAATLSNLATCAGLPTALADANAQLIVSAALQELLADAVDTKQLGAVVATDAPVHLLVAADSSSKRGKPVAAVSIGLSSLERARSALERSVSTTEVMPGMWKIGVKSPSAASCFIAASAGSTPARLICGDRDRDVTALGPYLARTLPTLARETSETRDVRGEIRFAPLSAKFGGMAKQQLRGLSIVAQSQFSIGEPKFDRALLDAAGAVQDELTALIGDADKVTLDLNVDGKSCLTITDAIQLRGATSWLAGTIADRAASAGPAPALFWRAPKDSDTAFFSRGVDPARYADILKTMRSLLEGWLNKQDVGKPADRKALADLLAMPLGKDTSSVSAHGHIDVAPAGNKGGKPSAQDAIDGTLASWLGWNLVGVDEAPATIVQYLKDFVAVYNRPALLGALKKELGKDDAKLLPTLKTVPAPKELGKSSIAIEMTFKDLPAPDMGQGLPGGATPGAKQKTMTLTLHLLVMGEDKSTWIAFGASKQELLKRLASVKTGAPEADTLAARPGLESLKTGKVVSGGFLTIAPLTRGIENGLGFAAGAGVSALPPEARQLMNTLSNLPHKGEGLMMLTTQVQGGGAPRAELSFNLSKPALEDIGAITLAGLKLAGVLNH